MSTQKYVTDEIILRMRQATGTDSDIALGSLLSGKRAAGLVSNWRGNDRVPDGAISKCSQISGALDRWLRTGEGPMFANSATFGIVEQSPEVAFTAGEEKECCVRVPIYSVASAGPGSLEPEWAEPICHRMIQERFIRNGVRPVLVSGRSMEPTLKNGAVVGVDLNDKRVVSGETYAVMIPHEGAVVKRLYLLPTGILLRSDNKEFPEFTLPEDRLPAHFILGRVCWVVQDL